MANEMSLKAITHIPGWAEMLEQSDKVSNEPKAFMQVPLIYRAVKLRSDALSKVPIKVFMGDDEIEWPFITKPKGLIWQIEAGMLLKGAAFLLKLSDNVITRDLIWLNPFSIEVEYSVNDDGDMINVFRQPVTGLGPWTDDQIVYFREWDPVQDTHPGISPTMVALGDARLLNYITRFSYHFFDVFSHHEK